MGCRMQYGEEHNCEIDYVQSQEGSLANLTLSDTNDPVKKTLSGQAFFSDVDDVGGREKPEPFNGKVVHTFTVTLCNHTRQFLALGHG